MKLTVNDVNEKERLTLEFMKKKKALNNCYFCVILANLPVHIKWKITNLTVGHLEIVNTNMFELEKESREIHQSCEGYVLKFGNEGDD